MGMSKALAALAVMFVLVLSNPSTVPAQTWDEISDPEKAYRNCMQTLMDMMSRRQPFERVGCPELLRNPRKEYDQADQKANAVKPRLDQATQLARQWRDRFDLLTNELERAEAECRAGYFSSSAACQRRDQYKKEQEEASFNQRKADEIRSKLENEYRMYLAERDGWANRYQDCKAMERSLADVSEDKMKDQQLKCRTLYTLMEYSSSGKPAGPTTGEPKTPTSKPPSKPQTPTARTVKIGYVNYQKLSGFTVSINGTSKSCSGDFDMSRPYTKGDGACTFEVPAGPCSISVSATGCTTLTFQHTCDKDETMMTTLSKAQ